MRTCDAVKVEGCLLKRDVPKDLPIFMTSSLYSFPLDIPRERATKPVALATMASSKLILEPSAKLVTIAGFWPHLSAKLFWVLGLR